jgi:hypothetical protein
VKDLNRNASSLRTLMPDVATASGNRAEEDVDVTMEILVGVPSYIDTELHKLYGNIHSTLAHLRVYGGLDEVTHSYVARRQGMAVAVFLFCRDGNTVHVINEGMAIGEEELDRFAGHVFSGWPEVSAIRLHAVQSNVRQLRVPYQQYVCTANIVLPLPATAEEYIAGLGKNMRRNLRRYMDKLKRDFPSFRYEVFEKGAASEQHIREIIDLNRARIAGKNIRYALDDEVEKVIALVRECGMVGVMTIDGCVVGGTVGYFGGDNYFFKVISHDPRYNGYSAGILCCYLTICECIARGCREYNFMWNEYEYKFALGAHSRSLHHLVVYRSRLHMLLRPRLAVGNALAARRHRIFSLLDKAAKPESLSPGERWAVRVVHGLRRVKQISGGGRV